MAPSLGHGRPSACRGTNCRISSHRSCAREGSAATAAAWRSERSSATRTASTHSRWLGVHHACIVGCQKVRRSGGAAEYDVSPAPARSTGQPAKTLSGSVNSPPLSGSANSPRTSASGASTRAKLVQLAKAPALRPHSSESPMD